MSELVSQQSGALTTAGTSSSSSYSSSSSSSFSATSSSSSSSSTKMVKQSATTMKSSSSSSSMSSSSTSHSSAVSVRSSGMTYSDQMAGKLGIDINKEMDRLKLCMNDEMTNIHRDMFRLMPGSPEVPGPTTDAGGFLVKMDNDAVRSCIDKANDDRVKLNFDVNEFDSETINIKTVGNKIEVHAAKKAVRGDEERSEEFSRVYELPTETDVDPSKVTSSIYKDGVLTIELPVSDALGEQPK